MFTTDKTKSIILPAGSRDLVDVPEGQAVQLVGDGTAAGTVSILDPVTQAPTLLWTFGTGNSPQFGPYLGDRALLVQVTAGNATINSFGAAVTTPQFVQQSGVPTDNDGRPNGTIYFQIP